MIKFWSICRNTFTQTIRQPIYGILILVTFGVMLLTIAVCDTAISTDYHATNQKMLEDLGLSTLLMSGLFISAFAASSVLSREIEDRTALTVISKPVPRGLFVLGKFVGVAAAVAAAFYLCAIVFLLTVRQGVMPAASDAYDIPVIVFGCSALGLTLVLSMVGNYLFSWPFTSTSVWAALILFSVALLATTFVGSDWQPVPAGYKHAPRPQPGVLKVTLETGYSLDKLIEEAKRSEFQVQSAVEAGKVTLAHPKSLTTDEAVATAGRFRGVLDAGPNIDPPQIRGPLIVGLTMMFLAVLVLTAVAVTASTRLGQATTLLVCVAFFVIGSVHSFLFEGSQIPLLKYLGWLFPKLSYAYPPESPAMDKIIPLDYLAMTALYYVAYIGAVVGAGMALFQTRSLEASTATSAPAGVNSLAWVGRALALAAGFAALLIVTMPATYYQGINTRLLGGALAAAVGAVLTWLLWGFFGRGVRWAYWVVATMAGLSLVAGVAWIIAQRAGVNWLPSLGVYGSLAIAVCIAIVVVLILPRSRRHFFQPS